MAIRYVFILCFVLVGVSFKAALLKNREKPYFTKELIREEFEGSIFLSEDALMLGTGNQFYNMDTSLSIMENVCQQDTVYTAVNDFRFPLITPKPLCKLDATGEDTVRFANKRLLKRLNKHSVLDDRIEAFMFVKVKVKYKILGTRPEKHVFLNWDYKKRSEPLLDVREVINVYISCVE